MNSLSFPDSNVWLALAAPEHVHAVIARRWWEQEGGMIGFSRLTQLGFLRLMTTAAVMDGKPLTSPQHGASTTACTKTTV
jgi:predicted nucleic acid-binding protein